MEKDFIIAQVSWLTQAKRNYEFNSPLCYLAYENIIRYFQKHNLTTRTIIGEDEMVDDDTLIKVSDLTNEGFELFKKCFDRWIAKVMDRNIEPTNYKMLDNALKKNPVKLIGRL
jgi:hypothetical protein